MRAEESIQGWPVGLPVRNALRGKAVAISENWPVWEVMGHLLSGILQMPEVERHIR